MQTILEQLQVMAANPANEGMIVELWNACIEHQLFYAEPIFRNISDELNFRLGNLMPTDVLIAATKGEWNPQHRWAHYDSDQRVLKSTASVSEFIDFEVLSAWILAYPEEAEDLGFSSQK